jgi:hypothetical protein
MSYLQPPRFMGIYMWSTLGWEPDDSIPLYRTSWHQMLKGKKKTGKEAWETLNKTSALIVAHFPGIRGERTFCHHGAVYIHGIRPGGMSKEIGITRMRE